jgi:hypothetical protein
VSLNLNVQGGKEEPEEMGTTFIARCYTQTEELHRNGSLPSPKVIEKHTCRCSYCTDHN